MVNLPHTFWSEIIQLLIISQYYYNANIKRKRGEENSVNTQVVSYSELVIYTFAEQD